MTDFKISTEKEKRKYFENTIHFNTEVYVFFCASLGMLVLLVYLEVVKREKILFSAVMLTSLCRWETQLWAPGTYLPTPSFNKSFPVTLGI